ncbi:MAG: polyhydroxyalkanoic acid system family protein [Acidobacteriota bacterium]|nr:polyhydroxyalkanoic acid system family protein [Acidobacteriota bacterium]
MRIAIPHHTTKANARSRVDEKLSGLLNQFGGRAEDLHHEWSGDTLSFQGKAKGFSISGTVEITDEEIIVDGKLPFMAKPFEPKIREAVKREADEMFRTA